MHRSISNPGPIPHHLLITPVFLLLLCIQKLLDEALLFTMDDDDEDSDLEVVIEGKIVNDDPDKPRRTTVQLTEIVDHRYNHDCEEHFIAGKDSKTYYASLRNQRAKEMEREKENAKARKEKKKKPTIYEQLKAKKREDVLEQQRKRQQETEQYLSTSSSSSSIYGEMLDSVRVPPPSDVFRANALARAKRLEEEQQLRGGHYEELTSSPYIIPTNLY